MSALKYCSSFEEEEKEEEENILDKIIDTCYDSIIQACEKGKITDDNAVIASTISLMERIIPKILDTYKDNPKEYHDRALATASAIRVTIDSFMPFDKFMELMNDPDMIELDKCVEKIQAEGKTEETMDELTNIFQRLKGDKKVGPNIYG